MKLLPAEMQEQMRHGLTLHKAEKDKLVTLITANSDKFTAEELGTASSATKGVIGPNG